MAPGPVESVSGRRGGCMRTMATTVRGALLGSTRAFVQRHGGQAVVARAAQHSVALAQGAAVERSLSTRAGQQATGLNDDDDDVVLGGGGAGEKKRNDDGNVHVHSSKAFNLLSHGEQKHPTGKHRPQYYDVHRPENTSWWRNMDRASFRKLLEECMATGRVSSPLRKYIAEFPIFATKWKDQELVLIVGALIRMNKESMALELLENQMQKLELNRLNRVIAESARLGNAEVALGALDIARHFNLTPDVVTYTSAIHACARGKREDIPTALELFSTMLENNVKPNHRTYGAVVLAYAGLAMWEEIEAMLNSIPYDDSLSREDVFAAAIITCTKNFHYPTATRLFRTLLDEGIYPGEKVCNAAMSACARTLDMESLDMFYKMLKRHGKPSIYTLNTMISAYGNARQMEKAFEIYRKMPEHDVVPNIITYNTLLTACMRARRMDMVPTVLEEIAADPLAKWNDITLNILLNGCAMARDAAQAEKYWQHAIDDSVYLDRRHFEALLEVYHEAGEYAKCIDVWTSNYTCRRRALTYKTLNCLISACARLGDDGKAQSLLQEFEKRGLAPSAVTHNHIMETYLAADKPGDARTHIHQLAQRDGLATTYVFTQLMKYYLAHDCAEDAMQVFHLYVDTRSSRPKWMNPFLHYPSDAIYVLAARAALQAGEHADLLDIYSTCPKPTSMAVKTEMAKLVIESCDKADDWQNAVSIFDQITHTIDDDTNVELYETVVKMVARAGEFEKALDVNGGEWYRNNRLDRGWGF